MSTSSSHGDVYSGVGDKLGFALSARFNAGANHRGEVPEITSDMFEKVWRLACVGAGDRAKHGP